MKSEFCWACTVNAEYSEAKTPCLKPHTHWSPKCTQIDVDSSGRQKRAQNGFKMTFGGACIAVWLPAGVRVGCCWFPRSTNKSPQCVPRYLNLLSLTCWDWNGSQTKSGLFGISRKVVAITQLLNSPNSICTILWDWTCLPRKVFAVYFGWRQCLTGGNSIKEENLPFLFP